MDWVTVAALPLSLVGLSVTWWQARNAARSAEAANSAVRETEQKIRVNQLMVLIPQLRWTVADLETAISNDDAAMVRRQLESWRWQAGNIHGMLSAADPAETRVLKILQQSVGLSRTAGSLLMDPGVPVMNSCNKARGSIVVACDELNTWLGRSSTQTQDGIEEK